MPTILDPVIQDSPSGESFFCERKIQATVTALPKKELDLLIL